MMVEPNQTSNEILRQPSYRIFELVEMSDAWDFHCIFSSLINPSSAPLGAFLFQLKFRRHRRPPPPFHRPCGWKSERWRDEAQPNPKAPQHKQTCCAVTPQTDTDTPQTYRDLTFSFPWRSYSDYYKKVIRSDQLLSTYLSDLSVNLNLTRPWRAFSGNPFM